MTTPWRASVLTIFPDLFPGPLGCSVLGRALEADIWSLDAIDLRDFATDRHRSVDDTPFGGGAGMVMRPDVVAAAVAAVHGSEDTRPLLYMSPRGRPFGQDAARRLAAAPGAVILCGRYEGVDERALEACGFEEVSLGDFVMTGGEIAAMALLDATVRLLPGVVGSSASLEEESFSSGLLEYPHYTRPQTWQGRTVPPVLLSGHHAEIHAWRQAAALALTRRRRPDLLAAAAGHSQPDSTFAQPEPTR